MPPRVAPRLPIENLIEPPEAPGAPRVAPAADQVRAPLPVRLRAAWVLLWVFWACLPLSGFALWVGAPLAAGLAGLAVSSVVTAYFLGAE